MLFNSYEFVFGFLFLCLLGYYGLHRLGSARLLQLWLLLCSLFFYGWWDVRYLALLAFSIGANFLIGRRITHGRDVQGRKRLLVFGLVTNIALLGYFKYFDFFLSSIDRLPGISVSTWNIVLPLAISFFTFQQIAYLVTAYRGTTGAAFQGRNQGKNRGNNRGGQDSYGLVEYALFVSFFPQLIAGPITRAEAIIPQLRTLVQPRALMQNFAVGLSIFTIGLFKKTVIADQFSEWSLLCFSSVESGATLSTADAWIGTLSYSFQIYFDFSAYSDMAIGLGRMFGIILPLNFNSPYKSASIVEFWRRWHITLSNFLRDYLYIPLGGNRQGSLRTGVNILLTMLIGGLWHGAAWTFVIWGGVHGLFIVINHLWSSLVGSKPALAALNSRIRPLSIVFTLFCVSMAWVLFRADSFASAWSIYGSLFALHDAAGQVPAIVPNPDRALNWLVGGALIAWFAPNVHQIFAGYNRVHGPELAIPRYLAWKPNMAWLAVIVVMGILSVRAMLETSEFLYFQF